MNILPIHRAGSLLRSLLTLRNSRLPWRLLWLLLLVHVIAISPVQAATSRDRAMETTVATAAAKPFITLNWSNAATSLNIYRRVKGATTWDAPVSISSGVYTYADMTALPGVAYEYSLKASNRYGGIVAGYNVPLVENRGRVILLVDNTMTAALGSEIAQLQKNMVADGWTVIRHDVPRETVPPSTYSSTVWAARIAEQQNIRSIVQADYNTAPDQKWALFILGRVPVPYSGLLNPDGHSTHAGAWPTDMYYSDVDGTWTDTTAVNTGTTSSSLSDSRNYNVPGDGKFDTKTVSSVELQCGRVDLSNMASVPTGMSETELLRQYLVRDNKFRKVLPPYNAVARRGIVDDNFNAYADTSWCSGFAFFGNAAGQMDAADWFGTLSTTPMLFAYGCGGGTWTSASGVGDSILDFGKTDSKAVFNILFGSFFGDWDCTNNFLRAPLAGTANSLGLTCVWSGLGEIPLYHMALGETIGYSVRSAINNTGTNNGDWYQLGNNGFIHQALMGDPTLRLHSVAPPAKVVATSASGGITLTWAASSDASISGYHVYRSTSAAGPFTRITGATARDTDPTGSPLSAVTTTFTDTSSGLIAGIEYTYMIKAVKMETSASGTYANQSLGESATITHLSAAPVPTTPTRLVVNRTGTATCALNWDDNATDETGYLIERSDPLTGAWSQVASVGANVATYTDTDAAVGLIGHYRVRATNANGNSDYSNEAADFNLPGIVYETSYFYLINKAAGTCSPGLTRFNGTAGAVGVTYTTTGILGTPGVDYTATTSTATWQHATRGAKALNIPVPNPASPQLTKIFQITYSSPTNGLALGTPLKPYMYITDLTARTLPSPWATATLGTVTSGGEGYAESANRGYGLAVQSGAISATAASDSGRFLYMPVTGDFTFSARIAYFPSSTMAYGSMAGLAIRASTASGAVMDAAMVCYDVDITRSKRATTSAAASGFLYYLSTRFWLRIVRSGNTTDCSCSYDGVSWTPISNGTNTSSAVLPNMPTTAYVGFILSSGVSSGVPMCYAQFDNVSIVSADYPAVGTIATFTAASGSSAGQTVLNWSAATSATSYLVERSTLTNSGFVKVATVASPTLTYTDTGLKAGTTYYYRVLGYNAGNGSAYTAIASAKPYVPSDITGWRYTNFGTTSVVAGMSGDLDTPGKDGIANLMKYALGLPACDSNFIPTYTSKTSLPVIQPQSIGSDRYLTCTLTHNKSAPDVTLVVEVTSDLNGTWTTIDPLSAVNQVSVTDNTPSVGIETIVVKDIQPITATATRFMRFKVTR